MLQDTGIIGDWYIRTFDDPVHLEFIRVGAILKPDSFVDSRNGQTIRLRWKGLFNASLVYGSSVVAEMRLLYNRSPRNEREKIRASVWARYTSGKFPRRNTGDRIQSQAG